MNGEWLPVGRLRCGLSINDSRLTVQYLCNMYHFYRFVLSLQNTFHVHETAHIYACNIFCMMLQVIGYPVLTHFYRHCFFGHAECATKTAAFILSVQPY